MKRKDQKLFLTDIVSIKKKRKNEETKQSGR